MLVLRHVFFSINTGALLRKKKIRIKKICTKQIHVTLKFDLPDMDIISCKWAEEEVNRKSHQGFIEMKKEQVCPVTVCVFGWHPVVHLMIFFFFLHNINLERVIKHNASARLYNDGQYHRSPDAVGPVKRLYVTAGTLRRHKNRRSLPF